MFANRNDPSYKPYSYTREEESDPFSNSFKKQSTLDNININQDLNDHRRNTYDNRGNPQSYDQPQKYRLNKPDLDSGQPLRQNSLVG